MASISIGTFGTWTISNGETDTVAFSLAGTLNIAGTAANPITVTLAQVAGLGALDTINITDANVTLSGTAGVSALVQYNIGSGGTLTIASTLGVSAGTLFSFTGTNSKLVLANGIDLSLLGSISGFAPGSSIDITGIATSASYADSPGTGTGGVLNLLNSSGVIIASLHLATGEYVTGDFRLTADGNSGTLVDFGIGVASVAFTPATADLGVGNTVAITVATSAPIIITGGVPTLALNDGGTARYNAAASSGSNLVFNYTVAAGQNTADLAVTSVALNGATTVSANGVPVDLSGAAVNPAGILQIDTAAPTITALAANPATGPLTVGGTVLFTLTTSEPVAVTGGLPTLTLSDGGTATYVTGLSTSTNLVFRYTVQPGQNSTDLAVAGVVLNGAIVADGAGNTANFAGATANPAGVLVIDTTAPTVLGVTTNPINGLLDAGQTVIFTVTTSEAVSVVGGTPTLLLNDGGTATYLPGSSTSTSLVFSHTVLPGQNTADLSVNSVNLNGATVADPAGNAANLAGADVNPPGILAVDTTAPTVSSVTTLPGSGTLGAGTVVALTVTMSEAVTVTGGTPTLALNDGGTATYDAMLSTSSTLAFTTTVLAGQNSADLAVTGVSLNGAVVSDLAGNTASLVGAITDPAGVLVIDTTAPTVTGVTTNPGSGVVGAGATVAITVATSEPVTVVGGVPTLTLSDGGTATYDPSSSTSTALVFDTVVQQGQNSTDLAVIGVNLNGATVADGAGNTSTLSGAVGNPPGILTVLTTGVSPTVTGVATTPSFGILSSGQSLSFAVSMSIPVTITGGVPTLTLSDGGTAIYDLTNSTASSLIFTHVVMPGQNTTDLSVVGVTLNGATVTDNAGDAADLSGAVVNPLGILVVDTTPPTVSGVTTIPMSGTFTTGQTIVINVATSEAVTVVGGTPTLTLDDGGVAFYSAALSSGTNLVFTQTIVPGENSADLMITGVNLNGATLSDLAGNAADLSGAPGNPPGVLTIDTMPPTVAALIATPATTSLDAGQTFTITVAMTEPVTVTGGIPTLTLSDGGTATYSAAASTPTSLVFTNTVTPGQNSTDLTVAGLSLNGAIITDAVGNVADLTGATGNPAGTLVIDTIAPTVTGVVTNPVSGTLTPGQTVAIDLSMSEATIVTGGTITLALSDGGMASYDPAHSTATMLAFIHTVLPGQSSADLAITGVNYNGSTATDAAGNAAILTGAITNPPGILVIDAASTQVTGVTTNPGSGAIAAGGTVLFQLATTTPVTITNGTPTLTLNDGGTAIYDAADSTPVSLLFIYTAVTGQNTPDLAITAASLGGATATGTGGIPFDISGAVTNPAGILQVDTVAPGVTNVSTATGDVPAGAIVTVTLTMSEPVTVVGGTPTLSLNDGGTAVFDPASSAGPTLVFRHTVQQGENTPELTVTGITLGGALITDAAGNVATFAGATSTPSGVLTVDTTPPVLTPVTATSTSGTNTVAIGQILMFGVDVDEPVTVSGGIPSLSLSNGGTATYDLTHSTPTRLVFAYTSVAGQSASALTVVSASLNGATISDPAGNLTDLSALVGSSAGTLTVSTPVSIGVYRFFDSSTGTHFFTADVDEKNTLTTPGTSGYRPDLVEETNNFGAVDPTVSDPARIQVYRFFDTAHGTHFFTASQSEATGIMTPGSGTYRSDLVYEPSASFYEHATQQTGDVAVYRFFDSTFGTHFYTGDTAEFSAITKPGSGSFRTDLVYEGVGFYAPAGTYR